MTSTFPTTGSDDAVVVPHEVRRLDVPLPLAFDDAVRRYEELVPPADVARFAQLTSWDAVLELAAVAAPNGFMTYWRADVPAFLRGSGADWRCVAYLMGNHTVAVRMFRHEPAMMLHAPLRTVIYENAEGRTRFVIDQPSTLFGSFGNPAITEVGRELDAKVARLLGLLGAPVPDGLE